MDFNMLDDKQNNRIKLRMNANPLYQSFDYVAFPCGIIEGSFDNSELWICSNILDIYFRDLNLWVLNRESSFLDKGPLITNKDELYYYDLLYYPEKVIKQLQDIIEDNWYIEGTFNEIAIPEKTDYKRRDNTHSFFIYGYDDSEQVFNAIGHTRSGQFESYDIKYETFLESVRLNRQDITTLLLTKPINGFECFFDCEKVYQSIDNYIKAKNKYIDNKKGTLCGIEALRAYANYLTYQYKNGRKIDPRNSRLLSENKRVFLKAIQNLPSFCRVSQKELEETYDCYSRHHYLVLKYNLTGNTLLIQNIINKLYDAIEKEKRILQMIV